MSTIHHLFGEDEPRPKPRARGPYRKRVTIAEIERAVRAAEKIGLTVYGLTIQGDKVHLQTKPSADAVPRDPSSVDDWFARRG